VFNNNLQEIELKVNNMDDLAILEVHELDHMQNYFKEQIKRARRNNGNTSFFEVELSYVQRELEIRGHREIYAENLRRSGYYNEMGV